MAARKRLRQTDETRAKIQTSQLINRLTKHSLAKEEIMTASQVNAAKILLAKTLPDLKAIEMSGGVAVSYEEQLKALDKK